MSRYADYDPFADVYNRRWGGFATAVVPVLDRLLLDDLPAPARLLDLCCGTGQLAAALSERGYEVVGVDGSEQMIGYARHNAPQAEFLVADARSFTIDPPARAAVCTYDSLNHLMSLDDLTSALRGAYEAIAGGGRFVFDLNMKEGFEARWRGSFAIADEDEVVAARSSYDGDAGIGRMEFTLMTRDGDRWRRDDVVLTQRSYTANEVTGALATAGFETVDVFDAQADLDLGEVGRSFFVAHRAGEP